MNISINNEIDVNVTYIPKKNKTDKTKYCLYLNFGVFHKGLKKYSHTISTGITVNIAEFKSGKMLGKKANAQLINDRLVDYSTNAKNMLNTLHLKKVRTPNDVFNEIKTNARQIVTGKATRGQKQVFISRLQEYSYLAVLERYLADKQLSKGRERNYKRTVVFLNEYFNNDVPTVDLITTEDLEYFKKWFVKTHPMTSNATNTYLQQIAAIFRYALKLKIINSSPLPENFVGSYVEVTRVVLDEIEISAIMELNDCELTNSEQIAKYCLLVQALTGIGFSDLKALSKHHIIHLEKDKCWQLEKNRNKTGVKFSIILTPNGEYMFNKLYELAPGDDTYYFKLSSIEYTSRMYKKIGLKAGLKKNISTYTLRHSYAVNYMENNGSWEDLMLKLGHNDIKTTKIYGKISTRRQIDKVKNVESKSKIHQLQPVLNKLKAV